jgi:hypothetical protein
MGRDREDTCKMHPVATRPGSLRHVESHANARPNFQSRSLILQQAPQRVQGQTYRPHYLGKQGHCMLYCRLGVHLPEIRLKHATLAPPTPQDAEGSDRWLLRCVVTSKRFRCCASSQPSGDYLETEECILSVIRCRERSNISNHAPWSNSPQQPARSAWWYAP